MQAISVQERKSDISNVLSRGEVYLSFALCNKEYGIEMRKIRKIIGITTPVSLVYRHESSNARSARYSRAGEVFQVPHYVKGIIKLCERAIPLIDLRLKLGFQEATYTIETSVIIVDRDNRLTGIIVDKVVEVLDISGEEIESIPYPGNSVSNEIFLGMARIKDKPKILLDIDKVLDSEEIKIET